VIEQPVRQQRSVPWLPRRRGLAGAGVAAAVLAVVAVISVPATTNLDFATAESQFAQELALTPLPVVSESQAGPGTRPDPGPPWVVFVGDRQAGATAFTSVGLLQSEGLAHYGGTSVERSCSLLRDVPFRDATGVHTNSRSCVDRTRNWRDAADAAHADVVLVQIGLDDLGDHRIDDRWVALGDPEVDGRLAAELAGVIAGLAAQGRTIALATLPTDWSALGPERPWALDENTYRVRAEHFNQLAREAVAAAVGSVAGSAVVVDIDRWHRDHGDGGRARPDGTGIDPARAAALARFVVDELITAHRATAAARPAPPGPEAAARRVLVVGDSTALPFAVGLHGRSGEHHDVVMASVARSNCGLARGGRRHDGGAEVEVAATCPDWEASFLDAVHRFRPDVVLVVASLWELTARVVPGDDRWRVIGDPVYDRYLHDELMHVVDVLHAGGAPVAFVRYPRLDLSGFEAAEHNREDIDEDVRLPRFNAMLDRLAAERPEAVATIDLDAHAATFPGGELDRNLRPDGVHFTESAARQIVDTWLLDQLVAVGHEPS
jgi:hypothetical protein